MLASDSVWVLLCATMVFFFDPLRKWYASEGPDQYDRDCEGKLMQIDRRKGIR